ncbi:hypothetical protein NPIL_170731 [Nephila pilipes]|uniref:Uncharacterized protein n=1 Tax=Nephila pilipes TaxID=299642 RepID=A0A8X6MXE5_NEPPI|nr:hypothetical protein NPIL_170731 [Nephila pilipes]
MIYRICQALNTNMNLGFSEQTGDFVQIRQRNVRKIKAFPAVYSFTVFKIYQTLDLKKFSSALKQRGHLWLLKKKDIHSGGSLSCSVLQFSGFGSQCTGLIRLK